jgi:hypothetical protein
MTREQEPIAEFYPYQVGLPVQFMESATGLNFELVLWEAKQKIVKLKRSNTSMIDIMSTLCTHFSSAYPKAVVESVLTTPLSITVTFNRYVKYTMSVPGTIL